MKVSSETVNVLRISLSMMILFTAILSHEVIIEPLIAGMSRAGIGGIQHTDGYLSLCIVYFFSTLSCLFAPYVVTRISGKWAVVIAIVCFGIFQASYLFPHRYGILAVSALAGIAATLLWVGQGQYISENVSDKNREKNTSLQWAFFKLSLIFGGIFLLLYFKDTPIESIVVNGQMKIFITVFMMCSLIACVNTVFLPQSEMSRNRVPQPFLQTSKDCIKLLRTNRMMYMFAFFFYTGLAKSFWISIYPACIKFTNQISKNSISTLLIGMIVTGCGQVIGSMFVAVIGNGIRKCGQYYLIIGALVLHVFLFFMISLSFPNESSLMHTDRPSPVFPTSVYIAMVISALLGFGDAVLQTQVYSYIAEYYQSDSGSVFSIFRFSSGISSTIMFFAAQYFYLMHHLVFLTTSAIIAGVCILKFHVSVRKVCQKEASNDLVTFARNDSQITN